MNVRADLVSVLVVRPDADAASHEFLQLRRSRGEYLAGTFQAVRGRIEEGEPAWRAALRELREETGLTPDEFYRLGTVETIYLPGPTDADDGAGDAVRLCPAFCAVVPPGSEPTLNDEHDAARWVARRDAQADPAAHFMWASEWPAVAEVCRVVLDGGPAKPYLRVEL